MVFVYIGIALIPVGLYGSLYFTHTQWEIAEKEAFRNGARAIAYGGTKIPCAGYLDYGFSVRYRRDGDDLVGRICRSLFDNEWVWYPHSRRIMIPAEAIR